MRIIRLDETSKKNLLEDLLKRSPNSYGEFEARVANILAEVKARKDAAVFDYSVFENIEFEIYGVEDYLCDYYTNGEDAACIADRLRNSPEKELFLTLYLNSTDANVIYNAISPIFKNKFYYW